MVVIAGSLIVKKGKILMVKEAKKKCYGQWNFPALNDIKSFEDKRIYPLDIFDNTKYTR